MSNINWLKSHEENPENFPLVFPEDNAGIWFEQMQDHIVISTGLAVADLNTEIRRIN